MNNQSWLELLDSSDSGDESDKINKTSPGKSISTIDAQDATRIVEIIDSKNQEKFDKLSQENRLKSPFKRRLENETAIIKPQAEKKHKHTNNYDDDEEEEESDDENNKKRSLRKRFCGERTSESSSNSSVNKEVETDRQTLDRRQKQIDYGKNTIGYDNYVKQVPKHKRTRDHPKTPPKHLKYSRRAWEGLIKSWRKKLHAFDSSNNEENSDEEVQE